MKIDGAGPIRPSNVRRTSRSDKSNGSEFARHLRAGEVSEDVATSASAATGRLGAVDSLLTLQEVPDAVHGRRRTMQRGRDLLARLDDIRHGLLLGVIPINRLKSLANILKAERIAVADANLAQVVEEIELRCAVELAKLEQPVGIY
jgi:hypothetical protein